MLHLQQQLQQDLRLHRQSSRYLDEMMKKSYDEISNIRPAVPQNMNINVEFQRIVVVAGLIANRHIESSKNLKLLARQTRNRVESETQRMLTGQPSNRLVFDPVWIREMFQENERESTEKFRDLVNQAVRAGVGTVNGMFETTRRDLPEFLRKLNGIHKRMRRDYDVEMEQRSLGQHE